MRASRRTALGVSWAQAGPAHDHRQLNRLFHETVEAAGIRSRCRCTRCAIASPPTSCTRHRHPRHPGAARSPQTLYHGALHARRHGHDRRHREPARSAVQATNSSQEKPQGRAGEVTPRGRDPSGTGSRGHLPRPRGRLACCQRRSRQPRPAPGDARDRALPHGGARRARRTLRGLYPYPDRLQLMPQPALPQVPGCGGTALAGRARSSKSTISALLVDAGSPPSAWCLLRLSWAGPQSWGGRQLGLLDHQLGRRNGGRLLRAGLL